jgi:ComF family protein
LQDKGVASVTSTCIECHEWLPYLRQARAPYVMRGTAAATVHALKYGGWRGLADEMGIRMAELRFDPRVEAELSGVVPVPLSPTRLRERGFNQAELLARSVAENRALPLLSDVLVRQRHTSRQARLSLSERSANVSGAFRVREDERDRVEDAHLLLVDDVLTTAATVQDCIRALCVGGARAASVLTFARARPELLREDE